MAGANNAVTSQRYRKVSAAPDDRNQRSLVYYWKCIFVVVVIICTELPTLWANKEESNECLGSPFCLLSNAACSFWLIIITSKRREASSTVFFRHFVRIPVTMVPNYLRNNCSV